MCGRYTRKTPLETIVQNFHVDEVTAEVYPSYNIAPGQEAACVIMHNGKRRLGMMKWGLIPSWAKDPSIGNKMINARAETITEKPSFKAAIMKRRCLIIADGYYEWKTITKQKAPAYIHLSSGEPFCFAGIYDIWISPEGKKIASCAIVTTEPNELTKSIHNRMPVIVPEESADIWLDTSTPDMESVLNILKPFDARLMETYPVSLIVNSTKNDTPECIQPLPHHD